MEPTPDELAGVVNLFGGLTREELRRAVEHVAARQGASVDPTTVAERIDAARRGYYLLAVEHGGETVLVAGPAALPALPDHGENLPHIMDVPDRTVDTGVLVEAARQRLDDDATRAATADDADRAAFLLDVCYDAEAWGPIDVDPIRERLRDRFDLG